MIDVEVEDAAWSGALPDACALARAAAEAVLSNLPHPADGGGGPRSGGGGAADARPQRPLRRVRDTSTVQTREVQSLTILLTDDAAVRELNARFRGQDKPTNVLSFPAAPGPERFLGDIALAYGTCAREAAEQGKPIAHHLQHLVAHGVLHLLGYDHMTEEEALEMEGLERVVLAGLGVPDPYAAGEGDHG